MAEPERTVTTVDLGPGQGVARIDKIHYANGPWVTLIILTPCEVLENGHVKPAASIEVGLRADIVKTLKEALS
jgi:hypothetical protein